MLKKLIVFLGTVTIGINSSAQARIGFTAGVDINYPVSDALYQCPSPGTPLVLLESIRLPIILV